MRRFSFLLMSLILTVAINAQSVSISSAKKVGTRFLQSKRLIKHSDTLVLAKTYSSANGQFDCFYVFNAGDGFVIVSADTRCTPILGYSFNGSFINDGLPENMAAWLEACRREIQMGIESKAPYDDRMARLWNVVENETDAQDIVSKDASYLLTSQWEQGYGYNWYCPAMNGEHVVVGCVATAMAQIIRYWQYPTRGFGRSSYIHSHYGEQAVSFDTVDYNYSLMPDKIHRRTSNAECDMVSRLCYHCGITVRMNYQNPDHTSGSGAHSTAVPDALKHFGYTSAVYYERLQLGNDVVWDSLIRAEIDARRPIYYSGTHAVDGGHAFILDGYDNQNRYHFNWGWGGYCDGFYTLSTMQGFTSSHAMVINIKPSGWDGHLSRFHISPEGQGGGTSWENTNNNISAAWTLSSLTGHELWLKEGVYVGDTNADYAFSFSGKGTIYGGFAGTESRVSDRDVQHHPTVFSGQGVRPVLKAASSNSSTLKLADITLSGGYSPNAACVYLDGDAVQADGIIVADCMSDSGTIFLAEDALIRYAHVEANKAPVVCQLSSATMRQSLLNNNDGNTLLLRNRARVVNCDIVSNAGNGVTVDGMRNSCVNNIVWNNDTNVVLLSEVSDTTFTNCAIEGDGRIFDSTTIVLSSMNDHENGPRFLMASNGRGTLALSGDEDWHLAQGSICINAGKRVQESLRDGDKDRKIRCRQGVIDIGCYESNYPIGIEPVAMEGMQVYPNPFASKLTVEVVSPTTVSLFDVTGRLLSIQEVGVGVSELNLEILDSGVYFLQMNGRMTKVVKQ